MLVLLRMFHSALELVNKIKIKRSRNVYEKMVCNCRFFSVGGTEEYNLKNIEYEYDQNPCQDFLIFGEIQPNGSRKVCELTKTAFSLKHWAFTASLKFLQQRKLRVLYRKQYIQCLEAFASLPPMYENFGYCVRLGDVYERSLYTFNKMADLAQRVNRYTYAHELVLGSNQYRNITPFCTCNLRIRLFASPISIDKRKKHYLNYSRRCQGYSSENLERNGHYCFCPRMNNQYIFSEVYNK